MQLRRISVFTTYLLFITAIVLASSGVIFFVSSNQVSHESITGYRWEPSSAVGSTWATSFTTYPSSTHTLTSYVSAWTGSTWNGPTPLTTPNGSSTFDVNLSFDATRNRFVFVLIDDVPGFSNAWYGYSTDSSGSAWVFGNKNSSGQPQPVFSASVWNWDYPTVGVDALSWDRWRFLARSIVRELDSTQL